jgi:hypothetical protein
VAQEKLFEKQVKQYLTSRGIYQAGTPVQKMTVQPHGWFIKIWGGGYQKSGIPDILICANGIFIGCELKASDGKASELQIHNVKAINQSGGFGIILYPEKFELFKSLIELTFKVGTFDMKPRLVEDINEGVFK